MTAREARLRSFAVSVLVPLLEKLSSQLRDVRAGEDIEHLHKARVSTRRLRAALTLFEPCFPSGRSKRWRRAVAKITGTLGEARDLDVQMDTVRKELRDEQARCDPGLARLLLRLSRRREKLQRRICDTLNARQIRAPLDEMLEELRRSVKKGAPKGKASPSFGLCADAIRARVADVLGYDRFVRDPASVKELHDLRKAGKRLRYALEIFEPLYEGALRPFIDRLKALQDLLGEIHDCDVWMDFLPRFLEEEAARTLKYYGDVRAFPPLKTGILSFLKKKESERSAGFGRFLAEWEALGADAFWEKLNTVAETIRRPRTEGKEGNGRRGSCGQMKILVLGDVHGNLPALEAVLEDGRARGGEIVINTGDYVGQGPFPDETVSLLAATEAVAVAGNFDRNVLRAKDGKKSEKAALHFWNLQRLSKANRKYLEKLPQAKRFFLAGKVFLLVHGSPEDIEEKITPETPDERLAQLAEQAGADIVLSGHSHVPMSKKFGETWFINPGTTGRPLGEDRRACYALVQIQPGFFCVNHYLVDYETARTADAALFREMPGDFASAFLPGLPEAGDISMEEGAERILEDTVPAHADHSRHVASIALVLFDCLRELHRLDDAARFQLQIASTLHDIGWLKGQKGHHKVAMDCILGLESIIPDELERILIASVARYHRKADPDDSHPWYEQLSDIDKETVRRLAAILRIADGLDWTHSSVVGGVECAVSEEGVSITCSTWGDAEAERARALEKGALFEKVFGKKLDIQWVRN